MSSIFKILKVFSPFLILSARRPLRAILARRLGCLGRSVRGFSRPVALLIRLDLCRRLCAGLGRFFFWRIFLGEYQFILLFDAGYAVTLYSTSDFVGRTTL